MEKTQKKQNRQPGIEAKLAPAPVLLLEGDVKKIAFCKNAVQQTVKKLGKLNILVNNAGMQVPQKDPKVINEKQQPSEVAPAYVVQASADASFITGQVIHVNGGEVVNG